jgi:hypothetical protein
MMTLGHDTDNLDPDPSWADPGADTRKVTTIIQYRYPPSVQAENSDACLSTNASPDAIARRVSISISELYMIDRTDGYDIAMRHFDLQPLSPRQLASPALPRSLSLSPPPTFLTTSTWKPQGLISPTFSSPGAPKS